MVHEYLLTTRRAGLPAEPSRSSTGIPRIASCPRPSWAFRWFYRAGGHRQALSGRHFTWPCNCVRRAGHGSQPAARAEKRKASSCLQAMTTRTDRQIGKEIHRGLACGYCGCRGFRV